MIFVATKTAGRKHPSERLGDCTCSIKRSKMSKDIHALGEENMGLKDKAKAIKMALE